MSENTFFFFLSVLIGFVTAVVIPLIPVENLAWRHVLLAIATVAFLSALSLVAWRFRSNLVQKARKCAVSIQQGFRFAPRAHEALYRRTPYVNFRRLADQRNLYFSFPTYNGTSAPIKIVAIEGNIIYEGPASYAGDIKAEGEPDKIRVNLSPVSGNPFRKWIPGQLMHVEFIQPVDAKLADEMEKYYLAGRALAFRLSALNILFSKERRSKSKIQLPLPNLIHCTKAPHDRTDVAEVNELRINPITSIQFPTKKTVQ